MRHDESIHDLVGLWDARRLIVDHRAGTTYRFAGTLRLTGDAFHETGEMRLPNGAVAAERTYRLRPHDTAVEVRFPDGRPFLTLDRRASQAVRHDCGADLYLGRFLFRDVDTWAEAWRVRGPAKRYSSLSVYRRRAEL